LIKENPKLQIAYFNAATLHEVYTQDFTRAIKYLEAYKDARAGELSPNDDVFKRIEEVTAAKAAEEERKRLEAEKKKAEEERIRRAQETLDLMAADVKTMKDTVESKKTCLSEEIVMELEMFVETAQEAITSKDTDMASDFRQMLDTYYKPMLDTALAETCGAAAPEGAPAEGTEGAPAEGAEGAPPAEAAPAEGAAPAPEETPAPQ
jgi:hypothetical protein